MRYILYILIFATALTTPGVAETCLTTTVSGVAIADDRLDSFCSSVDSMSNGDEDGEDEGETSSTEQ